MPLADVLAHTATPLRTSEGGSWIEGEWVPNPEEAGTPFACALFLPQTTSEDTVTVNMGRRVSEPTLLYEPYDQAGGIIGLDPEDSVAIVAAEINVAQGKPEGYEQRWQVVGEPQPFGRPGSAVIGFQATLRQVDES